MKTVVTILIAVIAILGVAGCSLPPKQSVEMDHQSDKRSIHHVAKKSFKINRSYDSRMHHMLMGGAEGYAYETIQPDCTLCRCHIIWGAVIREHCKDPLDKGRTCPEPTPENPCPCDYRDD